ncbi:transposase [Staphylococcus felis]|uniref:transposase n=1 Tax=Staphylococcus felis TaxID=46127 RepID=UPI000E229EFA|nr:transposase [Staphylococcus felis]REH78653.1 hypothetical protein DOS60_03360 [Staphylococcus felis]REI31906.1 hypothetical protein DOS80_05290 [Staphylococcus felis]
MLSLYDFNQEVFPNAKITIDRFHVIFALNWALNMALMIVMKSFKAIEKPLYNKYNVTGNSF